MDQIHLANSRDSLSSQVAEVEEAAGESAADHEGPRPGPDFISQKDWVATNAARINFLLAISHDRAVRFLGYTEELVLELALAWLVRKDPRAFRAIDHEYFGPGRRPARRSLHRAHAVLRALMCEVIADLPPVLAADFFRINAQRYRPMRPDELRAREAPRRSPRSRRIAA